MTRRFTRSPDSVVLHADPWVTLRRYAVERDGVVGTYTVVERRDAVVVVPLSPAHRTLLLRQFRFPTNASAWEFPMGGVDEAETAEEAGARELREEAHLDTSDLIGIGQYRPAPGLTPQSARVFVAPVSDAALVDALSAWRPSDEIEAIATSTLAEVDAHVSAGRITDGFTLAALTYLRLWLGGIR